MGLQQKDLYIVGFFNMTSEMTFVSILHTAILELSVAHSSHSNFYCNYYFGTLSSQIGESKMYI